MTINEVLIQLRRENREGALPEQVAVWCGEVDGWIRRKVWGEAATEAYQFPEDGDRELLVEAPWDQVYFYYACAIIDLRKRQYSDYANEMEMYNSLYEDYARHWRRGHRPEGGGDVEWEI